MKLTRALILSVLIIGIGWHQQSRAEPIIFVALAGIIAAKVLHDIGEMKQKLESMSLWGIAGIVVSLAGVLFAGWQAFRQRKKKRWQRKPRS